MALQAFDTFDVIRVENVIVIVYGDPGVGKGTLGNMAEDVLTLDYDRGHNRSVGRQRTLRVDSWKDTEEVLKHPWFAECKVLAIDTVGRALDLIADDIIAGDAKLGTPLGGLNQRGWGALKERFRQFFRQVKSRGKDVILVAHAKTEKDKDSNKTATPDIQGGSAGEVFKVADAMAYYSIMGGKRVLDFNATDNHIGKNPPGWEPLVVPHYQSDPKWFAGKLQGLKDHLNALSQEQATVLAGVADWQAKIEELEPTPEAFTATIGPVDGIAHPAIAAQVKTLLWRKAKVLGFDFDKTARAFVQKPIQTPHASAQEPAQGAQASLVDPEAGDKAKPRQRGTAA